MCSGHQEHHAFEAPEVNGAEIPPKAPDRSDTEGSGRPGRLRDVHEGQTDPVAICSAKRASVALPNTYHQLAVLRGTGWVTAGVSASASPVRIRATRGSSGACSSSDRSARSGGWPPRTRADPPGFRIRTRRAPGAAARRPASRPRSTRRRGRAHEQPRLREPPDGPAEVRTVDREHLELVSTDTPHPARDLRVGRPTARGTAFSYVAQAV